MLYPAEWVSIIADTTVSQRLEAIGRECIDRYPDLYSVPEDKDMETIKSTTKKHLNRR